MLHPLKNAEDAAGLDQFLVPNKHDPESQNVKKTKLQGIVEVPSVWLYHFALEIERSITLGLIYWLTLCLHTN